MVRFPDNIKELLKEAHQKFTCKEIMGFNYEEWSSFEEYEKYLKKLLRKDKLQ